MPPTASRRTTRYLPMSRPGASDSMRSWVLTALIPLRNAGEPVPSSSSGRPGTTMSDAAETPASVRNACRYATGAGAALHGLPGGGLPAGVPAARIAAASTSSASVPHCAGRQAQVADVAHAQEVGGEADRGVDQRQQPQIEPGKPRPPGQQGEHRRQPDGEDGLLQAQVVDDHAVAVLPCPGRSWWAGPGGRRRRSSPAGRRSSRTGRQRPPRPGSARCRTGGVVPRWLRMNSQAPITAPRNPPNDDRLAQIFSRLTGSRSVSPG